MEPVFQVYQCMNPVCRMRFSTDLSVTELVHCPKCGGEMAPSGHPYGNFRPPRGFLQAQPVDLVVILDNLRSTLNVGSIFRSSDGAGITHVYCCGTTPTPEHSKIAKTSLGAESFTPWSYHPNAVDLAVTLQQAGRQLIALESVPNAISLFELDSLDAHNPLALIVGNEISGIDPAILAVADYHLAIPMAGQKTSLNVAVSAGIAMYTLAERIKRVT